MKAHKIIIRTLKEDSAFICQVLEAHEGWVAFSTLPSAPHDPFRDLQLIVPKDWRLPVEELLESLKDRVLILSSDLSMS